ncbi:unnamed protein product [Coregonus sp. 'balchen']|nr:unnamed protein product [Coregonus sp. 'balchen']
MDRYIMIIACVLRVVRCYSSGAVTEACDHMKPQHSVGAQQSPAPFSVATDRSSFKKGDEITVQLLADATPFIGFMLQARAVGGSSPLGSFTVTSGEAQLLTCNGLPKSAISHTSASPKFSIQGTWRAPISDDLNSIQFRSSPVTFSVAAATPANSTSTPSTSTTSASSTAVFPSQSSLSISSAGCGSSKVCFSRPLNCNPGVSPDCYFLSATTSTRDTAIQLEMTGPSDGYIAIGFSDDQTMGNVSDVKSSMKDGIISCSFTTMNPVSTQRSIRSSSPYYLMFAQGPTSNGALMLIAWMTTGSLGMITARYLKGVAKGKGCCGKDAHVFLMTLTVAATIIAFILSFSHVRGWSGGAHPVLGCILMILAFFQPTAAMFRLAAIFTGLSLIDSSEDKWLLKVMGGFVGWEATLYILLDVHMRWKRNDNKEGASDSVS